jgi:hypothetical protein
MIHHTRGHFRQNKETWREYYHCAPHGLRHSVTTLVTSSARHGTVATAAVTTGQGWLFQRLGFEEFNLEVRMIEYRRLPVVSSQFRFRY